MLCRTTDEGDATVARNLLRSERVEVPIRMLLQPPGASPGHEQRAAEAATVRLETPLGQQLQIDFGELRVRIGGLGIGVYFSVATLGYSRRTCVRAGLSQRLDE